MRRFVAALLLALGLAAPAFAQTNVTWGLLGGNVCVYDQSPSRVCVTLGLLNSTTHTLTLTGLGNFSSLQVGGAPVATTSGALINGGCVSVNSLGQFVTVTGPCTSGGGGGTVTAALAGQLAYYVSAGNAVSGATTGTGILGALAVNTGTAGSVVVNGGALGTPASGVATNLTGLPISTGVSGLGSGVATALGNAAGATGGFATYNQLGTAAFSNIGTSGGTVPLLNSANTWGSLQTFGKSILVTDTSAITGMAILNTANGSGVNVQSYSGYGSVQSVNGSGGSTNSILALNPFGGNIGVGTSVPTGLLTIYTPTNSTTQALTISQNLPAAPTATGSFNFNSIWVSYNGVIPSTPTNLINMSVLAVNLATGPNYQNQNSGAETDAGAFGLTPAASNTSVGDQVALSGGFYYPYSTNARVYGIAGGGTCPTGCYIPQMIGIESDVAITGTGVAGSRAAFNAVNLGNGSPTGGDTAYQIANGDGSGIGGAFGQALWIQASSLTATANVIRADYTGNVGNIIYMPNITVTGDIINVPSYTVTGTGFVAQSGARMYGGTPSCSGLGGVCYGGTVDATLADCGSIAGMTGCLQINIAGTMHYIPFK